MEFGKSLLIFTTILSTSVQIYVPDEGINQKPVAYSQGIQTTSYRRPNQIQVDHSYSKVYSHNNGTISQDSDEDGTRRLYPVYNAHTYGARPSGHVYVINGTRIGRKSNPVRQIVAYNKAKRSPKVQIYNTCPSNATGQFVYEASCNQFLNCWKGRGYVQNCAPGTLFNPNTLECDFPAKVTCVSGPREDVLPKERSGGVRQIGCPQGFSGLIPNYTDCSKFINCVSGIENLMDCPGGTLFDINKNICDFAHKATCFNGQNENLKDDVDGKLDFGKEPGKGQPRYQSGEARCPRDFQGLVGHPADCAKFLNCANGQTFVQDCAPGTLFNPVLKICDFPYNVRCESGTGGYHHNNDTWGHGTYGNGGQNFDNGHDLSDFGNSGTNPYSSSHRGGTQNVYGGGQAPSSSGNQYENTNFYNNKGTLGTHDYGYSSGTKNTFSGGRAPSYGSTNDNGNSYNQGTSNTYDNHGPSSGTNSGGRAPSYGTSGNTNSHNQGTLDENYGLSSGTNSGGRAPSYGTSGNTNSHNQGTLDDNYGHSSGTNNAYNSGQAPSYGSTSNHRYDNTNYAKGDGGATYHQNPHGGTSNQNVNPYDSGSNIYRNSDHNPSQYPSSYGTTSDQNLHNQGPIHSSYPLNQNSGIYTQGSGQYHRPYSTSIDQNADTHQIKGHYITRPNRLGGDQYSTVIPYGTAHNSGQNQHGTDQHSWPGGTPRNDHRYDGAGSSNTWSNTRDRNYDGGTHGTKSSVGTYDQNSNVGSTYGHNSQGMYGSRDPHGIDSSAGTYDQNSNVGSAYGHNSQPVYGNRDTHGTQDFGGTLTNPRDDNQNRNSYGTKGYGDSFSHSSWPGTNQDAFGSKGTSGTYGQSSWNGQNQKGFDTNQNADGTFDGNTNHLHNQRVPDQYPNSQWSDYATTTNYDQVVNIDRRKSTKVPFRSSYEPFFGTTQSTANDYEDYRPNHSQKYVRSTTPRMEKSWPPPFPSTDVNADYVFEYEDTDVDLEAENVDSKKSKNGDCSKIDFPCSNKKCISKTLVCNGAKDCPDGKDEENCLQYVSKFEVQKNKKLAILEKERWDNVSIAACALMCVKNQKFKCRSFNYRKIDKSCFLSGTNEGLSGAIISYYPFDYYELISEKINCTRRFLCPNRKCIDKSQICNGQDDCGDRTDEKNCQSEGFGYRVRLTGSKNKHEGAIEVTAFDKTGFVCDDKFGLNDAHVVCKEMGYSLGAAEVKGNSFFAKGTHNEPPFYMMDDVTCTGNETRLLDCDFSGWGVHNCLGQEVAGVVCKTTTSKCASDYWQCDTGQECLPLAFVCDGLLDCSDGSDEGSQHCDAPTEIRLVNGTNRNQGRLEIRHHGAWGTVCDDDFNEDAAKVVCRQLGYKGSAVAKKDAYFGSGQGPIWLDQVFCSGNESSVEECTHWNWGEHNCDHNEDVGVICSNTNNYEERHSQKIAEVWKPLIYPASCGFRSDNIFNRDDDVHFRVVKGSVAKKGDYPWQAAIRVKGKTSTSHWCGAVVISEKFVLTAAHCLIGYAKGAYVIVAGDYNVDEDEGTEQEGRIEDYYLHESFRDGHKMNNDIALVKLKGRGFRFDDHVQPICLPDEDESYETELNCTISGFGSIESGKSAFSHNLRAGWIPLQKREICKMPHVYGDALTEGMFCAGSLDEGIDSCDGDSGGPLACLNRGVFTLYGITSWGQHCGYANKPGVYVKVAHYKQWIDDTFKKYS